MAMQKKIILSDQSRVSLADAGLGAAAGLLIPYTVDRYLSGAEWTLDQAWARDWSAQLGGVVGLALSIPLAMWRGFGAASIAGVLAVTYGLMMFVDKWLMTREAPVVPAPPTLPPADTATSGRLPPRRSSRNTGLLQRAGRVKVPAGRAITADVSGAYGGHPYA